MVRVLLVTHGSLAGALLDTAQKISGSPCSLQALGLDWSEPMESLRRQVGEALRELDDGEGVLILTDMYGNSVSRAATFMALPGRVEVVCGVNLPMVLRLVCTNGSTRDVTQLAEWIASKGRTSIVRATNLESSKPAVRGREEVCR